MEISETIQTITHPWHETVVKAFVNMNFELSSIQAIKTAV